MYHMFVQFLAQRRCKRRRRDHVTNFLLWPEHETHAARGEVAGVGSGLIRAQGSSARDHLLSTVIEIQCPELIRGWGWGGSYKTQSMQAVATFLSVLDYIYAF